MLCVTVGFAPSLAVADWTEFAPRPFENGAFLETFAAYEQDNNRTNGTRPQRWNDTFLREKLTLFSNGYSYHPRFVQYQFSVSGALRQEDYEAPNFGGGGWRYGTGLEYDLKLFVLPEHPYNLTLFAARYEPLFKEQAATQHNVVEDSRGVNFRYRKKPYFMHVGYLDDSVESAESSSDITRVTVDGQYFKRFTGGNELSFNGAFNPSWFNNSLGVEGDSTEYLAGNYVSVGPARLTSNLTQDSFDQRGGSSLGDFNNDQLVIYELFTAYLPWDFRSDVSYRYQDNQSKIHGVAAEPDRTLSDRGDDIQFDLVHRLYESLDTTYMFLRDSRTSSGGDTTSLSHSLTLNYAKAIPTGRLLAGINVSTTDTDNTGQADVLDEPHSGILVPGSFTLLQQNADRIISVDLVCTAGGSCPPPLVTGQRVTLVEGVHYTVVPTLNTFEIRVFALPSDFVVPGTFDFLVSYTLVFGDFSLRTNTFGGSTSVELFEDLITPYFSYLAVRSHELSGTFPGIPIDSTTYTTGLLLHRGPLRARGEYQDLEWNVSPYRAWRAELQYVSAVSATTSLYATAAYLNKYYPRGTSQSSLPTAYTEQTESVAGSVQQQLFSRNMFLAVGGSYSRLQGLVDTNAYAANGSLNWRIGKVELSLGANGYASDSSGEGTISTQRDHELVYLKIRRQLW